MIIKITIILSIFNVIDWINISGIIIYYGERRLDGVESWREVMSQFFVTSGDWIWGNKFPQRQKSGGFYQLHPPKQTWNLKMDPWKRRFLLETTISRFHVNFWEGIIFTHCFFTHFV